MDIDGGIDLRGKGELHHRAGRRNHPLARLQQLHVVRESLGIDADAVPAIRRNLRHYCEAVPCNAGLALAHVGTPCAAGFHEYKAIADGRAEIDAATVGNDGAGCTDRRRSGVLRAGHHGAPLGQRAGVRRAGVVRSGVAACLRSTDVVAQVAAIPGGAVDRSLRTRIAAAALQRCAEAGCAAASAQRHAQGELDAVVVTADDIPRPHRRDAVAGRANAALEADLIIGLRVTARPVADMTTTDIKRRPVA